MDLGLTGKTAVVTGGSKGIGLEIVRTLCAEGVRVVTGSRSATPGLRATGAVPVLVDLSTADGARTLADRALAELGGVDVLVNNVGVGDTAELAFDGFLDLPDEAWHRTFDLHFYSAVRVSRALLPSLVERRGALINISSINSHVPAIGPVDYGPAKAALNALGRELAAVFGPRGVRVNTVTPGPTRTGVWTDADGYAGALAARGGVSHDAFVAGAIKELAPSTGRMSEPAEIARTVAFLASPNNISGAEYVVDGGIVKAG